MQMTANVMCGTCGHALDFWSKHTCDFSTKPPGAAAQGLLFEQLKNHRPTSAAAPEEGRESDEQQSA